MSFEFISHKLQSDQEDKQKEGLSLILYSRNVCTWTEYQICYKAQWHVKSYQYDRSNELCLSIVDLSIDVIEIEVSFKLILIKVLVKSDILWFFNDKIFDNSTNENDKWESSSSSIISEYHSEHIANHPQEYSHELLLD